MRAGCSLKEELKKVYNEIKRFDVYYIELPKNESSIQSGLRPCVIVSNDKCNKFSPTITVVPITSQDKKYLPTHVKLMVDKESTVLCEQVMIVPKDLIVNKTSIKISNNKQKEICKALKIQLGL